MKEANEEEDEHWDGEGLSHGTQCSFLEGHRILYN